MADEGNGGACDVQGLPASDGSVRRKRGTRRSPWACQRGEAVAVAAANGVGGDGRACERETEEGMRRGRVREGVGAAWRHPGTGSGRRTSLQREAGGGQSRVEVARAAASRCPRPSGEEEDDRGVAVAGWAGWGTGPAGGLHGWHQVSPSLSFISISVLFYFI